MQNAKEGEADRLIDTRSILAAAERLPNLRWERSFLHTAWKDTSHFNLPRGERKRMILTFLSHRPKSAVEQTVEDKELQTNSPNNAVSINTQCHRYESLALFHNSER